MATRTTIAWSLRSKLDEWFDDCSLPTVIEDVLHDPIGSNSCLTMAAWKSMWYMWEAKLHVCMRVGMKVEQKFSDFSAEKRKRNENMETKMKICGTKTETDFFWRKWKRKWNSDFRRNRCGNGSFRFWLIRNFHFMVVLHSQSSRPDMWPCHIELSKQPTHTPPLH
jgi:hypothetical protein